jgi:adenine-specific DNA-methyltransferase
MTKKIDSIKHKKDKRAHIPSKEEAGYEDANPKVQRGKKILSVPLIRLPRAARIPNSSG